MRRVCMYCGKELGKIDGGGVKGISHSVCDECLTAPKAVKKNEFFQVCSTCASEKMTLVCSFGEKEGRSEELWLCLECGAGTILLPRGETHSKFGFPNAYAQPPRMACGR